MQVTKQTLWLLGRDIAVMPNKDGNAAAERDGRCPRSPAARLLRLKAAPVSAEGRSPTA